MTRPGSAAPWSLGAFSSAMPISGAKITATNQDTISAMPTTAKIEKVYSPAALRGEADRHEARDGDQRAGQHRRGERAVGEGRGRFLAVAGGEPPDHRVDRGHGVVDQQRQRDDQRAERDALQVDAERSP